MSQAAVSHSPASRTAASRGGVSLSYSPCRIGFVDLIDAAPLIVALENGYFKDEGIDVVLERQLGWGNIRDRLTFGQLDLAHALLGMPLFSQLQRDRFVQPLLAVMNLGAGGDAITLSRQLFEAGVRSATGLGKYIAANRLQQRLCFAHVFSASMHHYLLRDWLSSGGLNPDADLSLRVFPPSQMAGHMQRGGLDGFCVGEPWNTLAERSGAGRIACVTTDILPSHPEKVLAITRPWMQKHAGLLVPVIRAILRACAFCEDEKNYPALSHLLARAEYLNTSADVITQSLQLDRAAAHATSSHVNRAVRSQDWRVRSFAPETTFPSKTHSAWLAKQMIRWGHLPADTDVLRLAEQCADSTAYRQAAGSLSISVPASDFPPMTVRGGFFDPAMTSIDLPSALQPTQRILQ